MIADKYREKTAGMTESPWRKCDASEGDCKCGQITSIPADCGIATFHFGHSEDGFPYPSRSERNHNIDGVCFLANTRSEVADLLEDVERWADKLEGSGSGAREWNILKSFAALRERIEELG